MHVFNMPRLSTAPISEGAVCDRSMEEVESKRVWSLFPGLNLELIVSVIIESFSNCGLPINFD